MEETKNVVANENFDWNSFENDLGVYSQPKDEIAAAYDKTLSNVAVGEVVEGTVTGMTKREVIVNIGYKSEGIIPVSEFRYNPDLKVGDKIEVYVDSAEDKNGQLSLSHKKARQLKSWDRVNEALDKDEIIKGYIKCRTKGGMIVDVFGIEAFLPGSQIDVKPIRDYDVYVDKTMEFKVVKINQEFRNVVVSHKALIEAELEAQKQIIMSKLEKGQILEGTVKNITSYGVFVDLGGVDGLIHITDLSWGRVSHPEEIVALDQKIQVVILDFDDAKKRIALGLKQLTPHPWEALDQNLKVGDKVKGKVVVMADYGAFVEIAAGVEGLIHVSEMSWSQHLRSAQEFMKVGDEVEAVILTLDREERKMSLGIKQLTTDPWAAIETKYPVGTKCAAKVRNFTNFGVFVEIEEGIDGLIHISDLSWTKKVKHPGEFTQVGADIDVVVLEIDKDNRIKELNYKIYTPVTVRFVDVTSFAGIRVYQRTAWFILQKAVHDLYPSQTLHIRHSLGRSGFYCEIEGIDEFTAGEAANLRRRMHEIVAADYPIHRTRALTSEVRARYAASGYTDKIALLDTRPRLYSEYYTLDDVTGYFYGALAPSTGYITLFGIEPYYNGFYLALPLRTAPDRIHTDFYQEKMFGIFREYQSWVGIMGVPTVGDVNSKVLAGDAGGMIKLAEAFHERKFAWVADTIYEANLTRGTRMVLISGPSSSGKTTSAKRLGIQLGVLGLKPVMISLDDYFVEREKTPRDENGEYDYEALEAIDLELFNDHLRRLMAGESIDIPRYDFVTGRRTQHNAPLTLDERSILIIEGIHGLNPRLTPSIPDEQKFRIYISCFTSVAMDNLSRIATTDNRLLRRLVRDSRQRGADAPATLARWASVRRGEEKHIFPYQENADVMLNSSLFYEISVLRPYAEKMLREVPDTLPEYDEARRMLKFLDNFIPIPPDEIPPTSILREFIGGSSFKY